MELVGLYILTPEVASSSKMAAGSSTVTLNETINFT